MFLGDAAFEIHARQLVGRKKGDYQNIRYLHGQFAEGGTRQESQQHRDRRVGLAALPLQRGRNGDETGRERQDSAQVCGRGVALHRAQELLLDGQTDMGDRFQTSRSIAQQVVNDVPESRLVRDRGQFDGFAGDLHLSQVAAPRDQFHGPAALVARCKVAMGISAGRIFPKFLLHQTHLFENAGEVDLGKSSETAESVGDRYAFRRLLDVLSGYQIDQARLKTVFQPALRRD